MENHRRSLVNAKGGFDPTGGASITLEKTDPSFSFGLFLRWLGYVL